MRVHELADQLKITTKELMSRAEAELGITFKSHSATVTPDTITKIKAHFAPKDEKKAKPKAFVVKKAKDKPKVEEEIKEEPKAKDKVDVVEPKETIKIIEQPKLKSKLEIVRPAPAIKPQKQEEKQQEKEVIPVIKKPEYEKTPDIPSMIKKNFAKKPVEEPKKEEQKEDKKQKAEAKPKEASQKTPVIRHMISQDIYQNQNLRGKKKKKEKAYKNKEEEQERISLEKAVQQKHKKHTQATVQQEEVKQVVINRPMTINELADKIRKSPADIIKFLMLQGILVTVN